MRTSGTPAELESRRLLAVRRLLDGHSIQDVALFLEVEPRSVQRWWSAFEQGGWQALKARAIPGRPRKLSATQEKIVLRWLSESPTEFGFPTELWTCRRLSQLIKEEWSIRLHPEYLVRWLRQRGFTPQRPQRVPREREPARIADWLATEWPRIKKKRSASRPISF